MSMVQRFFLAILPNSWAESMEAESRQRMIRCPCGFERSIWEAGGIRWKAAGRKRCYLRCPSCGKSHWCVVYKRAPYP